MNSKDIKVIYFMIFLSILGLIIGSFFDIETSQLLYNRGNIFPNLFKFIGEIPMIIIINTSMIIIVKNFNNQINKLTHIILCILLVVFPAGSSITIPSYFNIKSIILSIFIFLFYILVSLYISSKIKTYDKNAFFYCLFVILSIIFIFITFNIMKNKWGRTRFFHMIQTDNYKEFSNWWILNGKPSSDIYKSFPSGHTAAAATSLLLVFIPKIFEVKNNIYFTFIPIFWTLIVGISRIFDGAHFLSDISMSILLSCLIILINYKYILEKNILINKLK